MAKNIGHADIWRTIRVQPKGKVIVNVMMSKL